MNGQTVELENCTFEGHVAADNCPSVEEELENIKKLKESEEGTPKEK